MGGVVRRVELWLIGVRKTSLLRCVFAEGRPAVLIGCLFGRDARLFVHMHSRGFLQLHTPHTVLAPVKDRHDAALRSFIPVCL